MILQKLMENFINSKDALDFIKRAKQQRPALVSTGLHVYVERLDKAIREAKLFLGVSVGESIGK